MPLTTSSADKRACILQATLSLLASCGFHGFSIKQLAQRAGVATGTIYLYFKDRDDLIQQLYAEVVQEVAQHLFVDLDTSAPLAQQYRQICVNFWRFCLANPDIISCKAQFDQLPSEVRRHQQDESKTMLRPLFELFEEGRQTGDIKPLQDDVLVSLAIEPFTSLAQKQGIGLVKIDERCLESVIHACWDAIAL